MNPRESRGVLIAAMCKLKRESNGEWLVPSQAGKEIYRVDLKAKSCTCMDHTEGGFLCKHFFAASFTYQRETDHHGNLALQHFVWVRPKNQGI